MADTTTLRRTIGCAVIGAVAVCDVVATGWLGTGERLTRLARSLAFPGIGFVEWQSLLASFTIMIAAGSMIAWLRWGADWCLVAVWFGAAAVTWFVIPLHHDVAPPTADGMVVLRASHEFAVVLVLMAAVGRLRVACSSWPGVGRRGAAHARVPARPSTAVDRSRAAAISAFVGGDGTAGVAFRDPDVVRRARRVARFARCRFGDPLGTDQAAIRAGRALAGASTPVELAAFRSEARRCRAGVPASEPTWVRPLDGTLAALALDHLGEHECVARWRRTFDGTFGLRHGRRRGALHTPSMLTIGTASAWEHAVASALARRVGWIGDDDWTHLRRRCLGAAARGARTNEDARLVAAGRVWAALVDDDEAARILRRPTLGTDELARAIDRLVDPAVEQDRR